MGMGRKFIGTSQGSGLQGLLQAELNSQTQRVSRKENKMPIVNGVVGVSEFTQEKANVFCGMMDIHTTIVKGILGRGKCEPFYHYIDLNAGPGIYLDDQKTPWAKLDVRSEYYEEAIMGAMKSLAANTKNLEFVRGSKMQLNHMTRQ